MYCNNGKCVNITQNGKRLSFKLVVDMLNYNDFTPWEMFIKNIKRVADKNTFTETNVVSFLIKGISSGEILQKKQKGTKTNYKGHLYKLK